MGDKACIWFHNNARGFEDHSALSVGMKVACKFHGGRWILLGNELLFWLDKLGYTQSPQKIHQ